MMKGNINKFWKAHQKSAIAQLPDAEGISYLTQSLIFTVNISVINRFIDKNILI